MADQTIMSLDVGNTRIGVAVANKALRFANPLTTVLNDAAIWQTLSDLVRQQNSVEIVVGLPRGLDGQETAQTQIARQFMHDLAAKLSLPVHAQDEAATSIKAKAELESRGKPYQKGDVDALAATYILEDYLEISGAGHATL